MTPTNVGPPSRNSTSLVLQDESPSCQNQVPLAKNQGIG